ncbi:MAG: ATP-binding protein [Chloroflexota bacterium]|jgi:hypothetical protein
MNELCVPRVVRGQMEQASYQDPLIPNYRQNPLIEALPKIYSAEEAYQRLAYYPEYQESQRQLPNEIRLHLIYNANQFFKPNWIHLDLEQRLSRLLRAGYLARNPIIYGYWREVDQRVQSIANLPRVQTIATGFNLVGISGIGKSTAMEAILRMYPQVIIHHRYGERDFSFVQVVWLKLDCPFDGSIKGLCVNFCQELDEILGTHYYENYSRYGHASIDELLGRMKRLTALHGIGCLVIDEIQHLSVAKSAGVSRMLNFFVQLVNTMGMPVVLVGTYKALPILTGEFRQARRASGQGDFVWERMQPDEVWQMFVETLWRYQYLRQPTPLTPQLTEALYEVSQGITDFAVKAYLLAQMRAIATGIETVTPAIIRSVALDSFRFAREVLEALRTDDWQKLKTVPDIQLVDLDLYYGSNLDQLNKKASQPEASTEIAPGQALPPVKLPESQVDPVCRSKVARPTERPAQASSDVKPPEEDLRHLATKGSGRKLTTYQVLQQAGWIKPGMEFFAPRSSS